MGYLKQQMIEEDDACVKLRCDRCSIEVPYYDAVVAGYPVDEEQAEELSSDPGLALAKRALRPKLEPPPSRRDAEVLCGWCNHMKGKL